MTKKSDIGIRERSKDTGITRMASDAVETGVTIVDRTLDAIINRLAGSNKKKKGGRR